MSDVDIKWKDWDAKEMNRRKTRKERQYSERGRQDSSAIKFRCPTWISVRTPLVFFSANGVGHCSLVTLATINIINTGAVDSLDKRTEAAFCTATCCSSLTSTWAVEVTSGQVWSDTRTCRWYKPSGTPSLMLSWPELWFRLNNLTEDKNNDSSSYWVNMLTFDLCKNKQSRSC